MQKAETKLQKKTKLVKNYMKMWWKKNHKVPF